MDALLTTAPEQGWGESVEANTDSRKKRKIARKEIENPEAEVLYYSMF